MNRNTALAVTCALLVAASGPSPSAQSKAPAKQKLDEAYTAKIKEYLSDPRISTDAS